MTVRDEGTVDGLPAKVRPAHQVGEGEVQKSGFGPKIDAILRELQGRDRRGWWIVGWDPEPYTHTEGRVWGAVLRGAADFYLQTFDVRVAAVYATKADGSCFCKRGLSCRWPAGAHPLSGSQLSVSRLEREVWLMPWDQMRAALALEMGRDSKLLAVTLAAGAMAPDWTDGAMTATWPDGTRTLLFVEVDAAAVASAPLGDGIMLHGDGALVSVPPRHGPSGITMGWDTADGGPAPLDDPWARLTMLPQSVLRQAARAARALS